MNKRKVYENMNISCNVISIGEVSCSYIGSLVLDENLVATLTIFDVEMDCYRHIEKFKDFCICAKAEKVYYTLKVDIVLSPSFSCTEIDKDIKSKVKLGYGISDILVGSEYAIDQNLGLSFKRFSFQTTDIFELIGMYPYEIETTHEKWEVGTSKMTGKICSMELDNGYSCFVTPFIYKTNQEYIFSMQGKIGYESSELVDIEELKVKIHLLILLFEILSGESISVLNIDVERNDKIFEYIGLCNYQKSKLKNLKNGFHTKSYLRKSIFKLSDWNYNENRIIEIFQDLVETNLLAMESYKQVLLDEELGIMTYNKFLKIMQMIEGIMRDAVLEVEEIEFNKKKENLLSKIENEEDKDFVVSYCNNNGVSFRTCLKGISNECICLLSGIEKGYNKIYKDIINKIINDRDVYTHASKKSKPVMSENEIVKVNCCYKIFFRIKILNKLGIKESLIRKRLLHDNRFVCAYKELFGLSILRDDNIYDTGEFDQKMWGYS